MTEYDFSPEAYEAYNRKQRSIDRWRQELTRHQPANPFKPIPGEHSEDEGDAAADDFVRVDGLSPNESLPNGAHAVPRASRQPRHQESKAHLKKGKKELKRSQSMQRPPLVAHNPPPQRPFGGSMTALGVYPNAAPAAGQYAVPPVPPLNQRYQQPQQFPATLALPHGTATRSYSSPAHPNVVAAHQMAMYQQYPYVNNIYAPQPQKQQPQSYSHPSSSSQTPIPSPPLYPTSRHFGVQMPGGLASQSSTALSSTTTIANPGVTVVGQAPTTILYPGQNQTTPQKNSKSQPYPSVPQHHQQQPQPQTYYVPQALPGGGMMYVPQGMTSPPAVMPMNAGAHAQAQAQAQWGYFAMPPPPALPAHKEEKTGFFGGLFHSGSRKDKTKKMSRRESF